MTMEDSEDQRDEELSALAAVFPELQYDKQDRHTVSLELPVNPAKAVTVFFPAATDGTAVTAAQPARNQVDSHELSHLPPVLIQITLPEGYPEQEAPNITISTTPPWLPQEVVRRLETDGPRLWEDSGRYEIAYTYVDHVQQQAEEAFGLLGDKGALEVDSEHKIAILDYDIKARKATFEKSTFDCGICLGMHYETCP